MNVATQHGYKGFYNGKEADIYAGTLLEAKTKAVQHFKVPKSKVHMVSVVLCEKDVPMNPDGTPARAGTQVVHTAVD